jgi:hypothetical protein
VDCEAVGCSQPANKISPNNPVLIAKPIAADFMITPN